MGERVRISYDVLVSVWQCIDCGSRYVGVLALDGMVLFGIDSDPGDVAPQEKFRTLDEGCACGGDVENVWRFATFVGGNTHKRPVLIGLPDFPPECRLRLN